MHRGDSQSQIIDKYYDEKVEDPFDFKEVDYDKTEWDNIPSIIPRYCIALTK